MQPTNDLLVWTDLETTGLEPETDAILEIACVITDSSLNEIATFCAMTNAARYRVLDSLHPKVQDMHTRNGLWEASLAAPSSEERVAAAFRDFLDTNLPYLDSVEGKPNRRVYAQLAGSTISFDRSFLRARMRAAHDLLHYRNLDVSTLNEVAKRFWPEVWEGRPGAAQKPEDAKHRAYDDILASIGCLRYYLENLAPVEAPDEEFARMASELNNAHARAVKAEGEAAAMRIAAKVLA